DPRLRGPRRNGRLRWLGGPGEAPERRGPWRRSLDGVGELRFDDLAAGRYRFTLDSSERLRFEPLEVRVRPGEQTRVRARPRFAVPTELAIRIRDRSGRAVRTAAAVLTLTEQRGSGQARTVVRRRISSTDVTLRRELFPGRYDVRATFGTSATPTGVFPRPVASVAFTVPEDRPHPRVEVDLVVSPLSRQAIVRGRIALGPDDLPVGFRARGTVPDEGPAEGRLRVSEDGSFVLRVDLDRIAGPQIELHSRRHGDLLGPFTLAEGAVDLGELRFRVREQEPIEDRSPSGAGRDVRADRSVSEFFRRTWDGAAPGPLLPDRD
ncbi:MAG: hypothetical protein AAGB93_21410, partial [Planctomycetota bacterium]